MLIETTQDWREKAATKRASISNRIPQRWRLSASDLDRATKQRNLTGAFIQGLVSEETAAVTARETADLVSALQKRELSATQVATAFCHVAAVAQQIVGRPSLP